MASSRSLEPPGPIVGAVTRAQQKLGGACGVFSPLSPTISTGHERPPLLLECDVALVGAFAILKANVVAFIYLTFSADKPAKGYLIQTI